MPNRLPAAAGEACIVCGSEDLTELVRVPSVPVISNQILRTAEEARGAARADIHLVGCRCCGHLFNAAFDPATIDYDGTYENSLLGSPHYREYTEGLVARLLAAHGLKGGSVVEIGCGRGEFLRMLCEAGMRHATGFDPGRPGETEAVGDAMMTIIDSPFRRDLAPNADLVCSRHVLEHLPRPVALLEAVRLAYASNTPRVMFLEVPNGRYTTEYLGIWDLIYEHVSYFTVPSLLRALRLAGFVPSRIEPTFGDQFLVAEARFGPVAAEAAMPTATSELANEFESFRGAFAQTLDLWSDWLDAARQTGQRLALWGAGTKGVTFLNLLDRCGDRAIGQVIDINPLKAGAFTAGTAHPVGLPSVLRDWQPDAVLLMNPEYETEVRQVLQGLDVGAELIAVSGRLPPMPGGAPRPADLHPGQQFPVVSPD